MSTVYSTIQQYVQQREGKGEQSNKIKEATSTEIEKKHLSERGKGVKKTARKRENIHVHVFADKHGT